MNFYGDMSVNFSNNNPYNDFIQVKTQPQAVNADSSSAQTAPIASVKVGDIDNNTDSKGHKKLFGIIGISVGSVALLTLIGLSTLSKGFASGLSKKLGNFSKNLQKKIYDLSAETKELTTSQKLKLNISKGMKSVADTLQASSNISAIKDSTASQWLKKLKLEPAIKKLNNAFKGVVTKTTKNAYIKAETSNLKFCSYLDDLAAKTGDKKLKEYAKQIRKQYTDNFSYSNYFHRTENAYKSMEGLDKEVYDILYKNEGGVLKNAKKLGSYVTTDLIAKDRTALAEKLLASKGKLSNNITDNYNNIKQILNDIKINVNPKDEKAVDIVKKLTETLESYKNVGGADEAIVREKMCKTFESDMSKLLDIFKTNTNYSQKVQQTEAKVAEFYQAIDPNVAKKGLAQDAITLIKEKYGKHSPEYTAAKEYMHKLNNNMNKAISSELNSYEKLAELQVGSAPTDILGILGPSALATAMVVNSKDKDERISKTFTSGVPILGGIGMSYYGTTRGFTGAKNLILGLGTGWVLNVVGKKVDEWYKKHIEKQNVLKNAFTALAKLQGKIIPEAK